MSGTDSPETGSGADTSLSFEDGAAAIEGLLSSVPDILDEDDQDSAQGEESQNTEGQNSEESAADTAGDDDEDEGLELEEDATDDGKPAPDDPKIKAGQFAPREAKVKLDDGTTISVADLIAGNMFQSTFTKKTTELKAEKNTLDAERSEFAETKKQVEHQRNVVLTLVNELMPKEPVAVDPNEDPAGYIAYLAEREAYQAKVGKLQHLWHSSQTEQAKSAEKQKKEQEEAERQKSEDFGKWAETENAKFYDAIPRLKDKANLEKWGKDVYDIGQTHYKLTEEEIAGTVDHRYLMILTDAIAFRKAVAKRDAGAKQPPAQAPQPKIPQRQRMAPQAVQNRDHVNATSRLRETGSLDAAAKALEKFV